MEGVPKHGHSTPSKTIINNVQEKYGITGQHSLIHSYHTPPMQKFVKMKNPFEHKLQENLHKHFLSPSVFAKTNSSAQDENFKWTIDELSEIQPADIDETNNQFETPERDPYLESFAQSRIDKFFSMKEIVPSPFTQVKSEPLIDDNACTSISPTKSLLCDNSAQTVLSLPPILPKHIEDILMPYFTYTQDQQGGELVVNNSIYRQLFEFKPSESFLSNDTSPAKSIHFNLSPVHLSKLDGRSTTPSNDDKLKGCELSPIASSSTVNNSFRYRYSSHMSVDNNSFAVPDIKDLSSNNQSLALDSSKSPVPDILSDSSVHWDLEYKQIASPMSSEGSSFDEMDVSNSNTPKSRNISGQRKKISDSFHKEMESDDEEVAFVVHPTSDLTDAGYQTGSTCEESWGTMSNLFASTPTKLKLFQ